MLRLFFIEWGFYNQLYKFWIAWGLSEEGVWKHFCLNEPESQEFFVTPKWQMMMWSKGSEDMMMVYIDSVDFRYVCPLREVPHTLSLTNHLCDPSSVLPNIAGLDIFSSYCFHSDTKPQPGWTLKRVVEFVLNKVCLNPLHMAFKSGFEVKVTLFFQEKHIPAGTFGVDDFSDIPGWVMWTCSLESM